MRTLTFTFDCSLPPASVLEAAIDFTDRRCDVFPAVEAEYYNVFPIVFGSYGLLSIKLARLVESGQATSIGAAILPLMRFGALNVVLLVLVLPLFVARTAKPIVAALIGTLLWAGLLLFFFAAIFPSL
jgi:hypothetical protein